MILATYMVVVSIGKGIIMRNRICTAALLIAALALGGCAAIQSEFSIDLTYLGDISQSTVETNIGALTDRADNLWSQYLERYAP